MSSNPKRDRENDHDDQEAEFEEGTEVIGKETSNMKGSGSMTTTSGANKKMKSNTGAAVPTSDSIFSLGGKRKVVVSVFKGRVLVNIREFYEDRMTGEEKPGKTGIALSVDQWNSFKEQMDEIQAAVDARN